MQVGGMVLCGGKSTRMGLSKADLPFGDERMLQRVVRLLALEVQPIVVVAAPGEAPTGIPDDVIVTHDRRAGKGPLEGLAAGLTALEPHAQAAYATGCDVPLLAPGFVRRMIDLLEDYEVAVATEGKFTHPLAAVYRVGVLPHIDQLLDSNQLRPVFLYERVATRRVPVEQLRAVDPELRSLANLNRPEDYLEALRLAGYTAPPDIAQRFAGRGE